MTRHGGPEVLELRSSSTPDPDAGEIRIAVRAAGVNFADVLARMGLYPDAPKPPCVVGYEVAGAVDAVGTGVTRFRVGDRVLALTRFGGYATHVISQEAFAFPVPGGLTDPEAAAIPVTYLTAAIALYRMANIAAGETVLVHGAAGGVGISATQLAKLRGAIVIGTSSASKHDQIRRFGVDHAIDYRTADVASEVRRITDGRGVDVILDPVGGRSFGISYRLLAPLGRMVIYGVSSIAGGERRSMLRAVMTILSMRPFKPISLMNNNRAVFGLNVGHLWGERDRLGSVMDQILAEVAAGRLTPVVARTFPLAEAAAAHRFMHDRGNVGKVLLTI
jgi:NADPH:quinone reductase-like Zn-dependent oxidoreductase